jgi:RNA polymerase sigma factor (sigma-70 family)
MRQQWRRLLGSAKCPVSSQEAHVPARPAGAARAAVADGEGGLTHHMNDTELVIAARAGDRGALDELARRYLPLVYNLAWRAMGGDADVDDVVQDIMMRALHQLPGLREPRSFRPWLSAIAMHQVSSHVARQSAAARQFIGLDEAAGRPDPAAGIEEVTLLHAELADQRRQVRHAGAWLVPEERALLGLWWLEVAGRLTRTDVASALGVNVAHAGVRLQRMRDQLEVSRSVVAALDAAPGCDRLGAVTANWDGVPSPFWRKRIARHVRSCAQCARAAEGMVPAERLLAGLALLPVPAVVTAAVVTKAGLLGNVTGAVVSAAWSGTSGVAVSAGGAKGWILGIVQATAAHPVAAAVAAGTLALGVTVTTTGLSTVNPPWSSSQPGARGSATPPSSGLLRVGTVSLESGRAGGGFVTVSGNLAVLARVGPGSDAATRRRATFEVVPGLADPACFSLRTPDGRYLRHSSWRLRLARNEGTTLFRGDATYCERPGPGAGSVSLESANFRGRFLRRVGAALWVDPDDGSTKFRLDSTFFVRPPLA